MLVSFSSVWPVIRDDQGATAYATHQVVCLRLPFFAVFWRVAFASWGLTRSSVPWLRVHDFMVLLVWSSSYLLPFLLLRLICLSIYKHFIAVTRRSPASLTTSSEFVLVLFRLIFTSFTSNMSIMQTSPFFTLLSSSPRPSIHSSVLIIIRCIVTLEVPHIWHIAGTRACVCHQPSPELCCRDHRAQTHFLALNRLFNCCHISYSSNVTNQPTNHY